MFVGAKVLSVDNVIYHVEIEDSDLGIKRCLFIMPHFDSDKLHRVIAALHQEWVVKGNGNPVELPLVDAAIVNGLIAEYQLAKEEAKNAEDNDIRDNDDGAAGDTGSGSDDIEHTSPEGEGFPYTFDPNPGPGNEQSVLDAVDDALQQPINQGGDPAAAASGQPEIQPAVEPVAEASGDGQGADSDAGEPQPGA